MSLILQQLLPCLHLSFLKLHLSRAALIVRPEPTTFRLGHQRLNAGAIVAVAARHSNPTEAAANRSTRVPPAAPLHLLPRRGAASQSDDSTCAELRGVAVQGGRSYIITVAPDNSLIRSVSRGAKTYGLSVAPAAGAATKSSGGGAQ